MTPHHRPKDRLPILLGLLFMISLFSGCLGGGDDPAPSDAGDSGTDDDAMDDPSDPGTGDGEDGMGDGTDDGTGDGGSSGDGSGEDLEACVPTTSALHGTAHDGLATPDPTGWDPESADPTTLPAQTTTSTFTVGDDVTSLFVSLAQAGIQVTLGWSATITDPDGGEAYSYSQAADANPEGVTDDSSTITAPSPGEWTVTLTVAGYVEGIDLSIDGETCV